MAQISTKILRDFFLSLYPAAENMYVHVDFDCGEEDVHAREVQFDLGCDVPGLRVVLHCDGCPPFAGGRKD